MRSERTLRLLAATLTLAATSAEAVDVPSRIQFVTGNVMIVRADGTQSPAVKGDVIAPGDRLVTGADGMAQVRAPDQGIVALRANSECQFGRQGTALDVALTRGQLRTVTDLGGSARGLINVSTPDAQLEVGDGDVETGVRPQAPGGRGESFSQVRTGVIKVDGVKGGALTLQPGQLATVGPAGPLLVNAKPAFVQPVLPLPTVSGGRPSDTSLGTLVGAVVPKAGFPTQASMGSLTSGVLAGLGDRGPGLAVEQPAVKLPDVRVEFANANVIGASSTVNSGLAGQTFLVGGRLGSNDKVVAPTATAIDPSRITSTVAFTPTTVQLANGQTISAIQPAGGSTLVTTSGIADKIVLLSNTLPAPTPTTVLPGTTLNALNTGNTIDPKVITTVPRINIGLLPKLR